MDVSLVALRRLPKLAGLMVIALSCGMAAQAEAAVDFNVPGQGPPHQEPDLLVIDCEDFGDLHDEAYQLAQDLAPPGLQDPDMPHCVILSPGKVMQWLDELGIDEQHPLYSQLPAELFSQSLPFVAFCCCDCSQVPEPASLLVWGALTGMGGCWYRRRRGILAATA